MIFGINKLENANVISNILRTGAALDILDIHPDLALTLKQKILKY